MPKILGSKLMAKAIKDRAACFRIDPNIGGASFVRDFEMLPPDYSTRVGVARLTRIKCVGQQRSGHLIVGQDKMFPELCRKPATG